jgi:hypothetical protein
MPRFALGPTVLLALLAAALPSLAGAEPAGPAPVAVDPARLMPAGAVVYAEFVEPGALIKQYAASALRRDVESRPLYAALRSGPQFAKLAEAIAAYEKVAKLSVTEGLDDLLGGGAALGLVPRADRPQPDAVVLLRGRTQEKMRKALGDALAATVGFAGALLVPPAGNSNVFTAGEAHYALADNLLVLSTNKDLTERVLKLVKGEGASLATEARFAAAASARPADARVWAWADIKAMSAGAPGGRLLPDKMDNILGPLLVGGPAEIAARAEYLTAWVALDADGLRLAVEAPMGVGRLPPTAAGMLVAPARPAGGLPLPARTIATVRLHRDLGAIWANREHTVKNDQLAGLAELDNLLTNAFGGRDFGQEILPGLMPEMHLVAVRQEFAEGSPAPHIKLPAFAWIIRARKPETAQSFQKAFKKFVGLLSYVLGEQARTDIDLDRETYRDTTVWYMDIEPAKQTAGSILYNFSPAVVVLGEWVAITSTRRLAREMIDRQRDGAPTGPAVVGDMIDIDGAEVLRLLEDNREGLIAQSIAAKGIARAQAAAEAEAILSAVRMFRSVRLRLEPAEAQTRLTLEIRLRSRN